MEQKIGTKISDKNFGQKFRTKISDKNFGKKCRSTISEFLSKGRSTKKISDLKSDCKFFLVRKKLFEWKVANPKLNNFPTMKKVH